MGSLITTEPKKHHHRISSESSSCDLLIYSSIFYSRTKSRHSGNHHQTSPCTCWQQKRESHTHLITFDGCFTSTLLLLVSFYCLTFLSWQELLDEMIKLPILHCENVIRTDVNRLFQKQVIGYNYNLLSMFNIISLVSSFSSEATLPPVKPYVIWQW